MISFSMVTVAQTLDGDVTGTNLAMYRINDNWSQDDGALKLQAARGWNNRIKLYWTIWNSRADDNLTFHYGKGVDEVPSPTAIGEKKFTFDPSGGFHSESIYTKGVHIDGILRFYAGTDERMTLLDNGNVGIGTTDPGPYKLAVSGKIFAKGIDVKNSIWPDFVFAEDYKLRPLEEVERFIEEHQHLPEIPSEAEVLEKGIDVGKMFELQMQKIEELTLYLIELKNENKALKQTLNTLIEKE